MDVLTLMGLVCFKACYYLNDMPQFKEGETCSRHTEILLTWKFVHVGLLVN